MILNARLRQSLAAVRSLGRRGYSVAAADTADRIPTFSSRWCRRTVLFPVEEGSDAYLTRLEEYLRSSPARVLITSHDGTIALLRRHRARIEALTRIALAAEPALAIAVNKERTLEIAASIGLRAPRACMVHDAADLTHAVSEIGLPAVLKPNESWNWNATGSSGAWSGPQLATTREEAGRIFAGFGGAAALYQQYLTGRREAVSFIYANGEIHARFAQWAQRTRPQLGGESVLRQSIAVPDDIGAQAEALIREIGLEGYSEVEFRRDAGGTPYLMEINPRLSASVGIAIRAGVDFPLLLYQWARGERIDRSSGYQVGQWMRHLGGDIMTTVEALNGSPRPGVATPARALLDFGFAFFRPMAYDYADRADPGPAVVASSNFAKYALERIVSRMKKSVT